MHLRLLGSIERSDLLLDRDLDRDLDIDRDLECDRDRSDRFGFRECFRLIRDPSGDLDLFGIVTRRPCPGLSAY